MGLCHPCNNDSSAHHPHHHCNTARCCHSDNQCQWLQNHGDLSCGHHCEKGQAVTAVLGQESWTCLSLKPLSLERRGGFLLWWKMTRFFAAAHSSPLEGWGQEQDASCVPTGMHLCPPCLCLCLLGEEPGCLSCAGERWYLESACKSLLINYCIGGLTYLQVWFRGKKENKLKGQAVKGCQCYPCVFQVVLQGCLQPV